MSVQHFMSYISKHYFCIYNCRLNAFMSCIKQCVNTSNATLDEASVFPLHCKDFVDTDVICLLTAQMSYYSK